MPDITPEINDFKNAIYGEDVRDAMVSLANKLNDSIEFALDGQIVVAQDKVTAAYINAHPSITSYQKLDENKVYQVHSDVPTTFGFPKQANGTLLILKAAATATWSNVYLLWMDGSLYKTTDSNAVGVWQKLDSMYPTTLNAYEDANNVTDGTYFVPYDSSNPNDLPANWPFSAGGVLMSIGRSNTGGAQYAISGRNNFAHRYKTAAGVWGDWYFDLNIYKTLTNNDDVNDITYTSVRFYNASQSDGAPTNWPIDHSGTLVTYGASSNNGVLFRIQTVYGYYGENVWRIGLSTGWSDWRPVAHTGRQLNYVAIGPSTTAGSLDPSGRSDTPEPYWTGRLGNYRVTNLAIGGTDFLNRHVTGTPYNNYMDVIANPDNAAVLAAADLITITVGTNDNNVVDYNGTSYVPGNTWDEKLENYMGNVDDYFDYNWTRDWQTPTEGGTIATYTRQQIYPKVTRAAAMNFIIKYVSDNFPKAQLVFVISPMSSRANGNVPEIRTVYVCDASHTNTDGTPKNITAQDGYVYLTEVSGNHKEWIWENSAWKLVGEVPVRAETVNGAKKVIHHDPVNLYKFRERMIQLTKDVCAAQNVAVADASDGYCTVWNAWKKFGDPEVNYSGPKGVHPAAAYADLYYRYISTAIISKLQN